MSVAPPGRTLSWRDRIPAWSGGTPSWLDRALPRLARRELADSLRNYWFGVNLGLFVLGGLLLMLFGAQNTAVLGHRGFARATAGLMQLALFVVPLMALFPSAQTLAGEREVGTLEYLLAQPVTRGEVYAGKWAGVVAALVLSLLVGFGVTGGAAAVRGVSVPMLFALLGLTLLMGTTFASLGLWISAAFGTRTRATSVGLTLWFGLVALGSLGLMGSLVAWGAPPAVLETWAFVNPLEAFRMATLTLLDPDLQVLGAVGAGLVERLGRPALVGLSVASMTLWSAAGYVAGRWTFSRLTP